MIWTPQASNFDSQKAKWSPLSFCMGTITTHRATFPWRVYIWQIDSMLHVHLRRQDEPNDALWLATRAGKMDLSCLLRLPAVSRKKNYRESHIMNHLLTKLPQSRWLDIGLVIIFLFGVLMDLDLANISHVDPLVKNPDDVKGSSVKP